MFWILFLFVCSLALALIFTPVLRYLALRCGYGVDYPDHARKVHKVPIPRIGGVPLVLAYAGSLGLLVISSPTFPHVRHFAWELVSASLLVFVTGLCDDLFTLKPWQKLLGEMLAGVLAYLGGIQIQSIGSHHVPDWLGLLLTVAWIIGCTNAFNLIDGLDGLAAGIGFLAAAAGLAAGAMHGNLGLVVATAPLAGALLGFLYFNFNPASIFLGDGGSLWTGFLLACFGVIWSDKSITVVSVAAPFMALSLPLVDTSVAILRRLLRGQSIFHADRAHIHHRLIERGFSTRRAVILLYAVSSMGVFCSLVQSTANLRIRILVIAVFCLLVWYGIHYLAYQEFGVLRLLLRTNQIPSLIQSHLRLYAYESSLEQSCTIDEYWQALTRIRQDFQFSKVEMHLGGRHYEEAFRPFSSGCWNLQVPLSDGVYVRFVCQYEFATASPVLLPLAELVYRSLSHKISVFSQQTEASNIGIGGLLDYSRIEIR